MNELDGIETFSYSTGSKRKKKVRVSELKDPCAILSLFFRKKKGVSIQPAPMSPTSSVVREISNLGFLLISGLCNKTNVSSWARRQLWRSGRKI